VEASAVRHRLEAAPFVALWPSATPPGSRDASAHEEALVTVLGQQEAAETVRLWVVIDHLVRGGAANAVGLLVAALADRSAPAH
jgi:aspartate-semialdehyde dehydrogenase